ncbi:MAG: hypothetical protein H8E86_09035 [Planctomycetes bacterium]|nr:hypothetical protein [Planctomycetota bacterium]
MGLGTLVIVVCGICSVQPVCTERDFHLTLGASIDGDHEFIARAVFDAYNDQMLEIVSKEESPKNSQAEQLKNRKQETKQAKALFDELLESLGVLNNDQSWSIGLVHLRRTVLLRARESNNPWPSTVWVDLPSLTTVPKNLLVEIDAFLLANIDEDIEDRFGAMSANLVSDSESCRFYEKRAMERWGNFEQIIAPYMVDAALAIAYPQLATDQRVSNIVSWILGNVQDSGVVEKANFQFAVWKTRNEQSKRVAISLIHNARMNHGFDPWSSGCGAQAYVGQSQIKNKLLQATAQMKESTDEIYTSVLKLLSPNQLQQFEDAQ